MNPRPGLIVTCEHASARVPVRFLDFPNRRRLAELLQSHRGFDIGARSMARRLAHLCACPLHEGRWSRLWIDLNRSLHHRRLIPPDAGGEPIPANHALDAAARRQRIDAYYRPYRDAVCCDIERWLSEGRTVLHLSIHSFTPSLHGVVRNADAGVLYDPRRSAERQAATVLTSALRADGLRARRNYPYRGTADGFTTWCRRTYPAAGYIGIEIELNQNLAARPPAVRRLAGLVKHALDQWAAGGRFPARAA